MKFHSITSWLRRIKKLLFLLVHKGLRYTYNYVHFWIFWARRWPIVTRLLYWLEPYPSYVEVEVTTRCNLKCVICEHTYWDEPNKDMSFDDFKYIVDQFPNLKWIGLTGIGESFLNKDFLKMLRYVKNKDVFVELYDTFFFIDEKTARELIKIGVDKMFVSLDAASRETYETIRVGSNFDRVIANVKRMFELKREMRAYFPIMNFHYIVTKLNLHEMPSYIELVHSLSGCEQAGIQFTRMLHEFEETGDLFTEIPQEIIQDIGERARKLGIEVAWNTDVPEVKPPVSQCIEWTMPFIFVTGHVIPCCSGNEANRRDFQKETALGNVFETDFRTIWRGERYRNLRGALRRGKVPLVCQDCCLYDIKRGH